jgi:hypothetical protein
MRSGERHLALSRTGEHAAVYHPVRHPPEALATLLLRARSPGYYPLTKPHASDAVSRLTIGSQRRFDHSAANRPAFGDGSSEEPPEPFAGRSCQRLSAVDCGCTRTAKCRPAGVASQGERISGGLVLRTEPLESFTPVAVCLAERNIGVITARSAPQWLRFAQAGGSPDAVDCRGPGICVSAGSGNPRLRSSSFRINTNTVYVFMRNDPPRPGNRPRSPRTISTNRSTHVLTASALPAQPGFLIAIRWQPCAGLVHPQAEAKANQTQ